MSEGERIERQPDFVIGVSTGDALPVYMSDDLPDDPERRARCEEHIREILGEAMRSFLEGGCDFDAAQRDGEINLVLACNGLTRMGRKCRLTMSQVDKDGKEVNRAKLY